MQPLSEMGLTGEEKTMCCGSGEMCCGRKRGDNVRNFGAVGVGAMGNMLKEFILTLTACTRNGLVLQHTTSIDGE